MADPGQETARPASVEDLKLLLRALNDYEVEYILIGGTPFMPWATSVALPI